MGAGGDNTTGHAGTDGQANLTNGAVMSDSKLGHGWVPPTNRTNASELTTNSGMGYSDPDRSMTVGARGILFRATAYQASLVAFRVGSSCACTGLTETQ